MDKRVSLVSINPICGLSQSLHKLKLEHIEELTMEAILRSEGEVRTTYKAIVAKGVACMGIEELTENTCTPEVLRILAMEL